MAKSVLKESKDVVQEKMNVLKKSFPI